MTAKSFALSLRSVEDPSCVLEYAVEGSGNRRDDDDDDDDDDGDDFPCLCCI